MWSPKRRRLTHTRYNLYSTVEMLMTRDGPAMIDAKARYSSHEADVTGILKIMAETPFILHPLSRVERHTVGPKRQKCCP